MMEWKEQKESPLMVVLPGGRRVEGRVGEQSGDLLTFVVGVGWDRSRGAW